MNDYIQTILLFIIVSSSSLFAQNTITLDSTILTEREVAIGIQVPWEIIYGPDDHLWVTEKRGRVLRIEPESGNTTTVLNIQSIVESGSEPGLLGMALHPDFEATPHVFLAYTYVEGGFNTSEKLVRYTWNETELVDGIDILTGIDAGGIHNGSRLLISTDNKILMTTGDVGSANNSQDMSNLNGKLLRINLDGSIPEDNPMPGSYIYSYGHRNSQGLAYGPNGLLYSSEHGAQSSDEFNIIEAGRNYGWPNVEGACNTNTEINFCETFDVKEPLGEYSPCVGVNGICYYNHAAIPEWEGKMLMAVLGGFVKDPRISVLELSDDGLSVLDEKQYFDDYGRLRDVCVNPNNGAIFFATNGNNYPSSGPNRIIEYRNLGSGVSNDDLIPADQFIKIYPNPISSGALLKISFSESFIGQTFDIIAFTGETVSTISIENTEMNVQLPQMPIGNYYLKASNKNGTITQKIIVQ